MSDLPMQEGMTVSRCAGCGTGWFPFRLMCAECGGVEFADDKVFGAVVEESTAVRRAWGRELAEPKLLATVRTDDGQVVIVGLSEAVADGARVKLSQRGQAVFASPA